MRATSLLRVLFVPWLAAAALAVAVSSAAAGPPGHAHAVGKCDRPFPEGRTIVSVQSGGVERVVDLFVPSGYDGRHRLPVLLNLHGSQENPDDQMVISGLAETAEKYDFIVASAQAGIVDQFIPGRPGFTWHVPGFPLPGGGSPEDAPDDEQYLVDTLELLEETLCIDSRRVYGTGFSGGARMISQFACDFADRVAAIAPVAGLRAGPPVSGPDPEPNRDLCNPSRAVPVAAFHGTEDPLNTYLDGGLQSWQYGIPDAMERWAELNGCRVGPRSKPVTEHVSRISYFGCARNARVVLYLAEGAGHTWPGSTTCDSLPDLCGPGATTQEISANELMWRFFSKYRLPN
jgi:polyhydroxybutyrate depolymerase